MTAWVDHVSLVAPRVRAPRRPRRHRVARAGRARSSSRSGGRAARGDDAARCRDGASSLRDAGETDGAAASIAPRRGTRRARQRYPDRALATIYAVELPLVVDRERARFSTLVRAFPALDGRRAGTPRHVARRARRACPTSRRWASTCSTCRRSIRSGASSARGRTTRSRQGRATSAARGRSAPTKAGTRRSIRELGTLEDFRAPRRQRARARTSSSRSTSPSSARPTIRTSRSTRNGSRRAPTARSSTPRTRRRNIRTSTRSTSSPTTGRRCGKS